MDEKVTKPTIETVLERMAGMEEHTNQRMNGMEERINQRMEGMEERINQRMGGMEERINQRTTGMELRLDSRLDRIESVANMTRSEMLDMRADFRDLTVKLKEHFPVLR